MSCSGYFEAPSAAQSGPAAGYRRFSCVRHFVRARLPALAVGLSSLLLSPSALLAAQSASADDQPSQATAPSQAAADATADELQEVVVTAEHVKADVQKTPIAMSVYGSDFLKQ